MRREIKRGDFRAILFEKSIHVVYKQIWSKVFYLQREPTEDDVDFLHDFAKRVWEAGRESLRTDIKELLT